MKINWKELSKSPGYESLKAAYIKDVQNNIKQKYSMRKKEEFLKLFNWVINRAKHYSSHLNIPINEILDEWEQNRDYWWLNYYGEYRQPKFNSKCLKPIGIKGTRKFYKNDEWYANNPACIKERIQNFTIWFINKNKPEKDKPRWSMKRKKRGY